MLMKRLPVCAGFTNGSIIKKDNTVITNVMFNGMEFVHVDGKPPYGFDREDFLDFLYEDECKIHQDRKTVVENLKNRDPSDVVVVYHGGCPDGVASAAVIINELGKDIQLIKGRYSQSLFDSIDDLTGKVVMLADFSYPSDEMFKIIAQADQVIFLDHHKSALESLFKPLYMETVFCHASVEYSGASLTWDFFHHGESVPLFVQYIEDGDLYKFELPDAYNIVKGLHSIMGDNIPDMIKLLNDSYFMSNLTDFRNIGNSINQTAKRNATGIIKNGLVNVNAGGYSFPMVNVTPDHTNLVGELVGGMDGVPFVMCYTILADKVKISLRSGEHGEDVPTALIKLGIDGGGHSRAGAGFMSLQTFLTNILAKVETQEKSNASHSTCACCS